MRASQQSSLQQNVGREMDSEAIVMRFLSEVRMSACKREIAILITSI